MFAESFQLIRGSGCSFNYEGGSGYGYTSGDGHGYGCDHSSFYGTGYGHGFNYIDTDDDDNYYDYISRYEIGDGCQNLSACDYY